MPFTIQQIAESVVSAAPGLQSAPSVTELSGGGWVVTWHSYNFGTSDIYQSVYAADGTLAKNANGTTIANQAVVPAAAGAQSYPSVAALADDPGDPNDGGWIVTWVSDQDQADSYDVYQSVYALDGTLAKDGSGAPIADQAVVSNAANNQDYPSVSALEGGGWVVTWQSDQGGTYDIYQRVYGVLTAGADQATGTGSDDTLVGTSTTLSAGDLLDAGAGTGDTLSLSGSGTFDLTLPQALTGFESLLGSTDPAQAQTVVIDAARLAPFATLDGGTGSGDVLKLNGGGTFDLSGRAVTGFETIAVGAGGTVVFSDTSALATQLMFDGTDTFVSFLTGTLADEDVAQLFANGAGAVIVGGVTVVNVAPSLPPGASLSIAENTQAVTTVLASDANAGTLLTYSIVGGADALAFEIDATSGALSFKQAPNFDVAGSAAGSNLYEVDVQASDGSLSATQTITVTVQDINEAPANLAIGTPVLVTENAVARAGGTGIASVAVQGDPDTDPAFTAYMYAIAGDQAAKFAVEDGELILKAGESLDFEAGETLNLTVTAINTMNSVHVVSNTVTVAVQDAEESPSAIAVAGGIVAEGAAKGTLVATLTGLDPDGTANHVYSLAEGDAGGRFELVGNQIVVLNGVGLDAEQGTTHVLKVRVTDGAFALERDVTITVADVAAETLTGTGLADILVGGAGNDVFRGMGGNDALKGGRGNDKLFGGLGRDTFTGGAGKDVFAFDTKAAKANVDKIADFNVRDDAIQLDNAVFRPLGKAGSPAKPAKMKADFFHSGTKAAEANDHVIYNKSTGALFYDADGSGAKVAVQIATLSKNLKLTAADFFVI